MLIVKPLHPIFAAELIGADLTQPPTPELVQTVEDAMARYGILVVRDAEVTDEQQIRFSRAFGPLEIPSRPKDAPPLRRMAPELFAAGNLDKDGKIMPYQSEGAALSKGAERFHADSSFNALPSKWSMLRGVECPPWEVGGYTLFIDTRAAYDALPEATKARIDGMIGIHDFWKGREYAGLEVTEAMRAQMPMPPAHHPLVRTMPYGRKALLVGGHCVGVVGMGEAEGHALVEELYAHVTQPQFIHRHQWTVGAGLALTF